MLLTAQDVHQIKIKVYSVFEYSIHNWLPNISEKQLRKLDWSGVDVVLDIPKSDDDLYYLFNADMLNNLSQSILRNKGAEHKDKWIDENQIKEALVQFLGFTNLIEFYQQEHIFNKQVTHITSDYVQPIKPTFDLVDYVNRYRDMDYQTAMHFKSIDIPPDIFDGVNNPKLCQSIKLHNTLTKLPFFNQHMDYRLLMASDYANEILNDGSTIKALIEEQLKEQGAQQC